MKKIMLLVASLFIYAGASASNVEKIQFANSGKFSLGLMAGIPTTYVGDMPFVSVDGMVGIKDGFIHTNKFGDNGAIDLGLLVGYMPFNHFDYWSMPIVARGGFHFEFVKKLDVYAGISSGVELFHWSHANLLMEEPATEKEIKGTETNFIFGNYIGAKWHFTDLFGLKVEFARDWVGAKQGRGRAGTLPWFAGGLSFNF